MLDDLTALSLGKVLRIKAANEPEKATVYSFSHFILSNAF